MDLNSVDVRSPSLARSLTRVHSRPSAFVRQHTACTVEMLDLQKRVDVGVIDEIQMMGDDARGWAWTRAILGLPANELHIAGDGSAIDLVRRLCEGMGEEFELREYTRLSAPLEIERGGLLDPSPAPGNESTKSYGSVKPGDCVVAFSRSEIFAIKDMIERETRHKAAVIYGNLPPETRRQQAKLFNDPDSGYEVLVASDAVGDIDWLRLASTDVGTNLLAHTPRHSLAHSLARSLALLPSLPQVGMGLNLNIGRIVFSSMEKRAGGNELTTISPSMTKQIAGRAGRLASEFEIGRVATSFRKDRRALESGLNAPLPSLERAGMYPEQELFEAFVAEAEEEGAQPSSFVEQLRRFAAAAHGTKHDNFFLCRQESTMAIAALLDRVDGLSIEDMYSFCMAPASSTDLRIQAALWQFASRLARGEAVEMQIDPGEVAPRTPSEMRDFEAAHAVVSLWIWLANRFGDETYFPDADKAAETAATICRLLSEGLEGMTGRASLRDSEGDRRGDEGAKDAVIAETAETTERAPSSGWRRGLRTRDKAPARPKTAKQLFHPYRNEFFALLKEKHAREGRPLTDR